MIVIELLFRFRNIDLTQNLSDRKILKYQHCITAQIGPVSATQFGSGLHCPIWV